MSTSEKKFHYNLADGLGDVLQPLNLFDLEGRWGGEEFSPEKIRDEILESLGFSFPIQVDDPLYQAISAFAYRELLLKQRINTVAAQYCKDLERIRQELPGVVGTKEYYEKKILSRKGGFEIIDSFAKNLGEGNIKIFVLLEEYDLEKENKEKREYDREKVLSKEEFLKDALETLNKPNSKLFGDELSLEEVKEKTFSLTIKLSVKAGRTVDGEKIRQNLVKKFLETNRIGKSFDASWFVAHSFSEEIEKVVVLGDIPSILENEILCLEGIQIDLG